MYNYYWCNALNYNDLIALTDEELCESSASGSPFAEEILVERYLQLVRKCSRPYFLAGSTSEDVIQEGMLGLLAAIREYSPDRHSSFKTFAERCIKNRIYSGIRSANREKHIPLNTYVSIDPLSSDGQICGNLYPFNSTDPEQDLLDRETYDELFSDIAKLLSGFENEVLKLYLEGLSIAEIAEYFSRPQKSVENAVSRVRRKLSRKFKPGDNK